MFRIDNKERVTRFCRLDVEPTFFRKSYSKYRICLLQSLLMNAPSYTRVEIYQCYAQREVVAKRIRSQNSGWRSRMWILLPSVNPPLASPFVPATHFDIDRSVNSELSECFPASHIFFADANWSLHWFLCKRFRLKISLISCHPVMNGTLLCNIWIITVLLRVGWWGFILTTNLNLKINIPVTWLVIMCNAFPLGSFSMYYFLQKQYRLVTP